MASELKAVFTAKKTALVQRKGEQFEALIRLQAPEDGTHVRMPLSIVAVIDRSGSMDDGRMDAAKRCTIDLVKQLRSDDEIGVVVYDSEITTVLPLTSVTTAQALIEPLMNTFDARGSTDLHGGWLAGAALLAPRTSANRVCRVILLSDGHANHGVTDLAAIQSQVAQLAQAGVTTTTVGIGLGFNEELMSAIATAGRGSALFGERPQDLAGPFESELGLLASLSARDVTMRIVSDVHGAAWRMHNPYAHDELHGWTLPSVAVGAEAWAAVSMPMDALVRARQRSEEIALHIEFSCVDEQGENQRRTASWDLSAAPLLSAAEYDALPADDLVVRRFQELAVAELLTRARAAVIKRDWKAVAKMLADVRKRAESNAWLESIVTELERMLEARDAERMGKEMHFGARVMAFNIAPMFEPDDANHLESPAFLRRRRVQGRTDVE